MIVRGRPGLKETTSQLKAKRTLTSSGPVFNKVITIACYTPGDAKERQAISVWEGEATMRKLFRALERVSSVLDFATRLIKFALLVAQVVAVFA